MTEDESRRAVIVTGLSGAGKASILRALEDIGYEAVDNPPLTLLFDLLVRSDRPVAIGLDARSRGYDATKLLETIDRATLETRNRPDLVYALADETVLLQRYTETRRRHPLAPQGRIVDGIAAEATLTAPLREAATLVIDTSNLPLAELRQVIERRFADASDGLARTLTLSLVSFGFPAGLPREAEVVFDVRFLRNPHYVADLKEKTGLAGEVAAYVEADADFEVFFTHLTTMVGFLVPRYIREGKRYLTIAIGCTGGQHRSVCVVERLARFVQATFAVSELTVLISHRELVRKGLLPGAAS